MKIVNFVQGDAYHLADILYATGDTPRQATSDIGSGLIASGGPCIVSGFEASFAEGSVTVSAGVAFLAFSKNDKVYQGVMVSEDAGEKAFDCSELSAGSHGVWVTFAYELTDQELRSVYNSGQQGFDKNNNVFTRQRASYRVVVAADSPGEAFLKIADVSLPDGAIRDARPLLFEGNAGDDFAPTWGSDDDRSPERGKAPIGDLRTMVAALQTAISDVKGGPWYAATSGGGGSGGGPGEAGPAGPAGPAGAAGARGSRTYTGNGEPSSDLASFQPGPALPGDVYYDVSPNNPQTPILYFLGA